MRVFVIGSKRLSVAMLDALVKHRFDVIGVISRDDEPGMKTWHELGHPSLKDRALFHKIPVYDGWSVNQEPTIKLLRESDIDFIFSCFWREIFKPETLSIPKYGAFNLHTAFLPSNRGSRPIPWALINGESFTGITLHKMFPGVDNGPIVSQSKVPIANTDTAATLYKKVTDAGIKLFTDSLMLFKEGAPPMTDQNEMVATYHARGEPFGGQINEDWDENKQDRFRRAFTFSPFRAFRNSPSTFKESKSAVYSLNAHDLKHCDGKDWNLKYSGKSIGNREQRLELKDSLSRQDFQGIRISGLENGLREKYAPLDVLMTLGQEFVSALHLSLSDLKGLNAWPHPFRYENGIIEIPAFVVENKIELEQLIDLALEEQNRSKRDIYLNLLINDIHIDLSKLLLKTGLNQLTFVEVCHHFDTPYEKISS